MRDGLASDVAFLLLCPSLQSSRTRQIAELTATGGGRDRDFSCESHDAKIMGRLYHSGVLASGMHLDEVGLVRDRLGFTILLVLCRAAAPRGDDDGVAGLDAAENSLLYDSRHAVRTYLKV